MASRCVFCFSHRWTQIDSDGARHNVGGASVLASRTGGHPQGPARRGLTHPTLPTCRSTGRAALLRRLPVWAARQRGPTASIHG